MPYSSIYRSAYLLGISAVSGTPGNLQTAQTIPYSTFVTGYTNTFAVSNIVVSGNTYFTTGNIVLSSGPASNIDIYGSFSGSNLNVVTSVYNRVTGTGTTTNLIVQTSFTSSNTVFGALSTGNLVANAIVSNGFYANALTTFVQAGSIQNSSNISIAGNAAFSNLTGNLYVTTLITTGNITGNIFGNLILTANIITQNIYGSLYVTNVISYNNIFSTISYGTYIGYGNTFSSTSNLATGNVYSNIYGGQLYANTILSVGTSLGARIIGQNIFSLSSNGGLFPVAINTTAVFTQSNNLLSNITGPLYTSAINTPSLTSNLLVSTMLLGANNASMFTVNAANLVGNLFTTTLWTTPNVVTSNLFGNIVGTNILTTNQLFVQTITSNTMTGDNVQALYVYSSNISAGNMNAFQNSSTASYVYGNFTGNILTNQDITFSSNITCNVFAPIVTQNTVASVLLSSNISGPVIVSSSNLTTGNLYGPMYTQFTGGIANTQLALSSNTYTILQNLMVTNITGSNIGPATLTGNLYMYENTLSSNTLIVGNLVGNVVANTLFAGNLLYDYDVLKQGYQLFPSVANSALISNSINSYINRPWWATSQSPIVSYYPIGGMTGYSDVVVLPDNRLVLVPDTASNIVIANMATAYTSNVIPGGAGISSTGGGWKAGVLLPDSNVFFVPGSNTYGAIYDPNNNILTVTPVLSSNADPFRGGILMPNGNVLCVPYNSNTFVELNPLNTSNVYRVAAPDKYFSASLLPNGNVICSPYTGNAAQYNYTVSTINTGYANHAGSVLLPSGNVLCVPGAAGQTVAQISPAGVYSNAVVPTANGVFQNACLLATGQVLFGPGSGTSLGVYDPQTGAFSNVTIQSGYGGLRSLADGRAVLAPLTSTAGIAVVNTFAPTLSPGLYYNHF